jgi:hypothetical protein
MIQPKTAGAKDALSRMQAFNQAPSLPVGSISAAAAKNDKDYIPSDVAIIKSVKRRDSKDCINAN